MALVLNDTYNTLYALTQIAFALYGIAIFYFEDRTRRLGVSFNGIAAVAIYTTTVFGFNSLIYIGNYFYDLKGGLLHMIFAKSQIPSTIASFIALVLVVYVYLLG